MKKRKERLDWSYHYKRQLALSVVEVAMQIGAIRDGVIHRNAFDNQNRKQAVLNYLERCPLQSSMKSSERQITKLRADAVRQQVNWLLDNQTQVSLGRKHPGGIALKAQYEIILESFGYRIK